MISCTEFIPLYSEFFKYLDKDGGHDAVMEYWNYLSDKNIGDKTNPNSLGYKCEKFGGFDGARAYWGHTLTEEACDLFEICDNKNRFVYEHMRHCPSRGMLNDLKHIEPYYDYCEHCKVIYSRVLEKYGVVYERDHSKINSAQCSSILYEKGNKPDIDFFNMTDDEIKKSLRGFAMRCVAGVAIFFLPTIISVVFGMISSWADLKGEFNACQKCILNVRSCNKE